MRRLAASVFVGNRSILVKLSSWLGHSADSSAGGGGIRESAGGFNSSFPSVPNYTRYVPPDFRGLEGIVAVECMVYAGVATRTGRKQSAERSLRQPDNASGCGESQHDDFLQPATGA
jgi:hypothetical protein